MSTITIVPIDPYQDGLTAGQSLGRQGLRARVGQLLKTAALRDNLGAMTRAALERLAVAKLETPPDYGRYPELADIYPERVEEVRGFAQGAGCSLAEAATLKYVEFREEIERWYQVYQCAPAPGHCSGVLLVGPDGVLQGQCLDSGPPPKPASHRWRAPRPYHGLRQLRTETPKLVLRRPRTGYIESWGIGNERGVAYLGGGSCGVWLDEPIEDTWPIGRVPVLRFARDAAHLAELIQRYTLYNWGRSNDIYADRTGNAFVAEKSYRRVGIRWIGQDGVLWATEGHFESPAMYEFLRNRRLAYVERMGKHLGAGDLQYATDCYVRFTRLGQLCHENWGRGLEHVRRIITDHSTFPRAICRHGGPDTAPYDTTVTMQSWIKDVTHNREYLRQWVPWKKFCCEVPEKVTQFPPCP